MRDLVFVRAVVTLLVTPSVSAKSALSLARAVNVRSPH